MPEINSASSNSPMTHLEETIEDDLGKENVLKLQLKLTSLLSIADQGSLIRKSQTKVNGNDSSKIEKNLSTLQNSSDNALKQYGPDLKLVISNKSSDLGNNPNTSFTNKANSKTTRSDSKSSDLVKHSISSSGDMEIVKVENEERNKEKNTAPTIQNNNDNNNINNNKRALMTEEDLIPAQNLNSGSNFTKTIFIDCSKKQDRFI